VDRATKGGVSTGSSEMRRRDTAGLAEIAERRAEELRSGEVKGVPADEVFAKARQRLGL